MSLEIGNSLSHYDFPKKEYFGKLATTKCAWGQGIWIPLYESRTPRINAPRCYVEAGHLVAISDFIDEPHPFYVIYFIDSPVFNLNTFYWLVKPENLDVML